MSRAIKRTELRGCRRLVGFVTVHRSTSSQGSFFSRPDRARGGVPPTCVTVTLCPERNRTRRAIRTQLSMIN